MIFVQRDPAQKPVGFDERSARWSAAFKRARRANRKLTISAFWQKVRPSLREDAERLRAVFHGKCAFCEAPMEHVASPHIEHYRPKSRKEFESLAFVWENWLLSCGKCNEKKWAHFPDCDGVPCLLDPTTEGPSAHIDFVGPRPLDLSRRGRETISMLGLDRSPLEDQREQWLSSIDALLLLLLVPAARQEARELLIWSMQPDAPYAAMTRRYLQQKVPKLAAPAEPHPRVVAAEPRQRIRALIQRHADALQHMT